jgi:hypothetical protein
MADDLDEAKRLLALEYDQIRKKIDTFDTMRFQVKGWCLTVAGGLLFLAINSSRAAICFLALAATWFFAYIEIIYINRQQMLFDRSDYLESIMESARRGGPNGAQLDSYVFGVRFAFPRPTPRRLDIPVYMAR